MDKILSYTFLALLAFTACKKHKNTGISGSMSATVGGTAFSSANCYVTTNGRSFTFFGLSGASANQPFILFSLYTFTGTLTPATYPVDGIWYSASYNTDSTAGKEASYGGITINEVIQGQKITGSFDFTCTDSTKVKGSFTAGLKR